MAMKAHRQGEDTTALLRLLSYRKMDDHTLGFVELHKSEARIRHGSLLVREQKVYMIPASQKTPLSWNGGFGICRHIPLMEMSDLYWWGIRVPQADKILAPKSASMDVRVPLHLPRRNYRLTMMRIGNDRSARKTNTQSKRAKFD
ncbi:hypothetical protein VE03_01800 [Pseudogymnoascus sp. 23342-1-I1]|nr:hypothetical protein VE03_01800 [Pseudogymnoascus sp. 23342-1-I1]